MTYGAYENTVALVLGCYVMVKDNQQEYSCDPETALDLLIAERGRVLEEYGGFIIEVIDQRGFPWPDVIRILLRINHEVWIEEREGKLYIVSKPKAD